MTVRKFLDECEEMALYNMSCYDRKPQYKEQYKQEHTKLEIIRYLMYLAKKYGTEEDF